MGTKTIQLIFDYNDLVVEVEVYGRDDYSIQVRDCMDDDDVYLDFDKLDKKIRSGIVELLEEHLYERTQEANEDAIEQRKEQRFEDERDKEK